MSGGSIRRFWALATLCLGTPHALAYPPEATPVLNGRTSGPALRPLESDDLVRLVDFGPVNLERGQHIFAVSPDRTRIALQIRQGDPATNEYHLNVVVLGIQSRTRPVVIDAGGDFILQMVRAIGGVSTSTGNAAALPIKWSPDGRFVYFLKRIKNSTQIWQAAADGSGSRPLSPSSNEVVDFALCPDGSRIIFTKSEIDLAAAKARRQEARNGYRYDERFIPLFANGPDAFATNRTTTLSLDVASGDIVNASPTDAELLTKTSQQAALPPSAIATDGRSASVIANGEPLLGKPTSLQADAVDRQHHLCQAASCAGASQIWWSPDGGRVRYMRREGWADSETAIYEWTPGDTAPNRLYTTTDLLLDCQSIAEKLLCAREQSTVPRQIILLDPASGESEVVYDPNPNFSKFSLGRVERLKWRNSFGVETFGDLVYPTNYAHGTRYPLIVVQYLSRGFLRGGVGDEFPIQAFANRGYAVLSIQRPSAARLIPDAKTVDELQRRLLRDFKDRRSVLSSIERAIHLLVQRGIVDKKRLGITGLSDGSSTVQYAIINSKLFKAASVSGCCWEPFQDAIVGPAAAESFHKIGWPRLVDYDSSVWSKISLISNANKIHAPLLMQQSDDEFRVAVASYTALKQSKVPVSLFVFPDEHHVKWQPAHRLAVYQRNLSWFDHWIKGVGKLID
ncbi:Atxe2 family lasso peptide isopeptidase [Sphingobium yanoikuyae]|jgi:dienelactone hydrolase|uniref:Atxe2 family lasso peptide isopeptidase n=1 Tax=Sphingobium yanoikuyae TaxID=13690 RepID=UPI0009B8282F|nr:Atxe2 family lasso peptide isopeptidase [Sphingobium yanoikuyae]MDV3482005.1 Atxe2 family lasso peptide isopeptidase [Sphingobium yanoikuyae]